MKRVALILLMAFFAGSAYGQKYGEDSVECRENLYIYYELAKKKNYLEAYDGWQYVYDNCPQSSKNNFIFGPYIVKAKIKEADSEEKKNKFKLLLMDVYEKRNEYYPGQEGYVYARKARDMVQMLPDSTQQAYELFNKALELDGPSQSAAFYNYFFVTAARLFNEKEFDVDDIFDAYNMVIEGVESNTDSLHRTMTSLVEKRDSSDESLSQEEEKQLAKAQRELERYKKTSSNIEKILTPIATCARLERIYSEEVFEEHKTDTLWLKRAVKMLQKKRKDKEGNYENCTDIPIFFDISDALYNLEPSAPAARGMFVLAYKDENYDQAAKYIREAAEFELDPEQKADDYFRLANVYLKVGKLASAKNAALKASRLRKDWGAPHVLIAQLYAAADGTCGSNVFEKKAVYWAAIDKLQYARSIDPSVASKADRLINSYKQQVPNKSVSFQLGHAEGEDYQIGCFVNETVSVKFYE